MRIMIAEDEQRARQGMERLIGSIEGDYEIVASVSNGQTALEQILELKPDLVFVDIKMPFLDGLSLIRAVRSHSVPTEFVVVSAYADFQFAQESISLQVAGYLLKPAARVEVEKVLQKVAAKLENRRFYSVQETKDLRGKYPARAGYHTGRICGEDQPEKVGGGAGFKPGVFQLPVQQEYRCDLFGFSARIPHRAGEAAVRQRRARPQGYSVCGRFFGREIF